VFVLLEKVKPALILLDIEMPEMNGYEVMKILRNKEKTVHIEYDTAVEQIEVLLSH